MSLTPLVRVLMRIVVFTYTLSESSHSWLNYDPILSWNDIPNLLNNKTMSVMKYALKHFEVIYGL